MNKLFIAIGVALLILVGGVFYFKNAQNSNQPASQEMQTNQTPTDMPTAMPESSSSANGEGDTAEEKAFTVEGGNFYFKPNEIRVKKGDKVKITLNNAGGTHDFVINEFNVASDRIGDGETTTVSFTADKTGTFEFYCSVGNHQAMGMKGNLIVE